MANQLLDLSIRIDLRCIYRNRPADQGAIFTHLARGELRWGFSAIGQIRTARCVAGPYLKL